MPRAKKNKVFVSYSRHDEALVRPLAGLLGVAVEDAVFLDVEQIKPGELWEKKIIGAVRESTVFVICWCCQSDKSEFVAREIATALMDETRRLVPVLFCSSSLPASLAGRQWIDLRGQVVHDCPVPHSHNQGITRAPEMARAPDAMPAMAWPQPMPPAAAVPIRTQRPAAAAAPLPPSVFKLPKPSARGPSRAVYGIGALLLALAIFLPMGLLMHKPAPHMVGLPPAAEERPQVSPGSAGTEAPTSAMAAMHGSWWIATLLISCPVVIWVLVLFRQKRSRLSALQKAKPTRREVETPRFEAARKPVSPDWQLPGAGRENSSRDAASLGIDHRGEMARPMPRSPSKTMLNRVRTADHEDDADVIARRAKTYFESLRS